MNQTIYEHYKHIVLIYKQGMKRGITRYQSRRIVTALLSFYRIIEQKDRSIYLLEEAGKTVMGQLNGREAELFRANERITKLRAENERLMLNQAPTSLSEALNSGDGVYKP